MFIEKIVGDLGDKRRWRAHKARVKSLPEPYRSTIEAVQRYLMYSGGITRGDVLVTMLDDLGDLFEQAASDRTPIREVVGDDPVEFVETFLANYSDGQWIGKERRRLAEAVEQAEAAERAERPDPGKGPRS